MTPEARIRLVCVHPYQCARCFLSIVPLTVEEGWHVHQGAQFLFGTHPQHPECPFSDKRIRMPVSVVYADVMEVVRDQAGPACELCATGSMVIDGWHYLQVDGMTFPTNKRCTA